MSFLNPAGRGTGSGKKARVVAALALGGALLGGGFVRPRRRRGRAPPARPFPDDGPAAAVARGGALPEPNRAISVGDAVPDFTLTDQTGRTVRLSQFRGEPVAVTFAYTRCPDATACPMTMSKFAKLNAALAKEKNGRLLAVTVDPATDTPAVLADYARRIGADPERWRFLTGDRAGAGARGRDVRRPLLPRARKDRAFSGGRRRRPGRPARRRLLRNRDWEPEQILKDLEKARNG